MSEHFQCQVEANGTRGTRPVLTREGFKSDGDMIGSFRVPEESGVGPKQQGDIPQCAVLKAETHKHTRNTFGGPVPRL